MMFVPTLAFAMPVDTNKAIITLTQSAVLKASMEEAGYFDGLKITQVLNHTEEYSSIFLACGAGAGSKSGTILKAEFSYTEYNAVKKLEEIRTEAAYFSTVGAGILGDVEFSKCDPALIGVTLLK